MCSYSCISFPFSMLFLRNAGYLHFSAVLCVPRAQHLPTVPLLFPSSLPPPSTPPILLSTTASLLFLLRRGLKICHDACSALVSFPQTCSHRVSQLELQLVHPRGAHVTQRVQSGGTKFPPFPALDLVRNCASLLPHSLGFSL